MLTPTVFCSAGHLPNLHPATASPLSPLPANVSLLLFGALLSLQLGFVVLVSLLFLVSGSTHDFPLCADPGKSPRWQNPDTHVRRQYTCSSPKINCLGFRYLSQYEGNRTSNDGEWFLLLELRVEGRTWLHSSGRRIAT